jgi:hypothetical protein
MPEPEEVLRERLSDRLRKGPQELGRIGPIPYLGTGDSELEPLRGPDESPDVPILVSDAMVPAGDLDPIPLATRARLGRYPPILTPFRFRADIADLRLCDRQLVLLLNIARTAERVVEAADKIVVKPREFVQCRTLRPVWRERRLTVRDGVGWYVDASAPAGDAIAAEQEQGSQREDSAERSGHCAMPNSGRAGAVPALEPQEAYPPARSTASAG